MFGLTSLGTNILRPPRQICPQNALDIIRAVLAGGWTSRSLASHTFILSFSFHGSQKTEVPVSRFERVCGLRV